LQLGSASSCRHQPKRNQFLFIDKSKYANVTEYLASPSISFPRDILAPSYGAKTSEGSGLLQERERRSRRMIYERGTKKEEDIPEVGTGGGIRRVVMQPTQMGM